MFNNTSSGCESDKSRAVNDIVILNFFVALRDFLTPPSLSGKRAFSRAYPLDVTGECQDSDKEPGPLVYCLYMKAVKFNLTTKLMKTNGSAIHTLDELVFENRNHEYGAYAIRKSYPDQVNKATLMVFGLSAVLVGWSFIRTEPLQENIVKTIPNRTICPTGPIIIKDIKNIPKPEIRKATPTLAPVAVKREDEPMTEQPLADESTGVVDGTLTGEQPSIDGVVDGDIAIPVELVPVAPPKVYDHPEIMPSYKGGAEAMMKFIVRKTRYPAHARRIQIEGKVFVSFIIGPDGSVLEAKVVKGIDKDCDEEALRVINMMPLWNPGMQGDLPVMVRMVIPIYFKLT